VTLLGNNLLPNFRTPSDENVIGCELVSALTEIRFRTTLPGSANPSGKLIHEGSRNRGFSRNSDGGRRICNCIFSPSILQPPFSQQHPASPLFFFFSSGGGDEKSDFFCALATSRRYFLQINEPRNEIAGSSIATFFTRVQQSRCFT
jgi:hypothetical protein